MNTQINYLYRDADNYKVQNMAIVSGEYTAEQVKSIIASLYHRENFLPMQVGLPEERFETWSEQSDGPWFELYPDAFSLTDREPTCDITIDELTKRFQQMADRWEDALDDDMREIGHSILDDAVTTGQTLPEWMVWTKSFGGEKLQLPNYTQLHLQTVYPNACELIVTLSDADVHIKEKFQYPQNEFVSGRKIQKWAIETAIQFLNHLAVQAKNSADILKTVTPMPDADE